MKRLHPILLLLAGTLAAPTPAAGQSPAADLSRMSIEELLGLEVTSASRKEQRAGDVAAAVFVITRDDIRRSGMHSIPELLRLVPGVDVAQVNSNAWAVSVRGFNAVSANKLQVLVDGRSIYDRISSGVIWNAEEVMLDDVDRIEVIRGPAAAMWGANAVNGVINIVTKASLDTQGGLVRVDAGAAGGEQVAARYGGTLGKGAYRVFAQWTTRAQSSIAASRLADDGAHSMTTGFRADLTSQPGSFVVEGSYTAGRARNLWPNFDPATAVLDPIVDEASDSHGGHVLGRWTHTGASGASFQVQSFVDVATRDEPVAKYDRQTFDVDTQYHASPGGRQDVVAGADYRLSRDQYIGGIGFSLSPSDGATSLVSAFVQDEISFFEKRVALTIGSQVQYDSLAGAGLQPTARVMWKVRPRQRLWAAASRALRTPSRFERGIRVDFPPEPTDAGLPLVVTSLGNPSARTETFADAEVGYRIEIGSKASVDLTGFAGRYDHLRTNEAAEPVIQFEPTPQILVITEFGNLLSARTRGVELSGHWSPTRIWELDGSYSAFHLTPLAAPASLDVDNSAQDGSVPRTQWQVRSTLTPGSRAAFNVSFFHVGPLTQLGVEAHNRADLSAEWRINRRLSVMGIGQNLLDPAHREFAGLETLVLATQVRRSASLRLRWTF